MDIKTLKELSKLSDRILNTFDEAPELTRGDFQGFIEAVVLKAYQLGKEQK